MMNKLNERLATLLNEYCKTLDSEKLAEAMLLVPEIALLEDAVEVLGDAPGAPIFVYVENFSRDEIIRWVQKYASWTMRRLNALVKLEKWMSK